MATQHRGTQKFSIPPQRTASIHPIHHGGKVWRGNLTLGHIGEEGSDESKNISIPEMDKHWPLHPFLITPPKEEAIQSPVLSERDSVQSLHRQHSSQGTVPPDGGVLGKWLPKVIGQWCTSQTTQTTTTTWSNWWQRDQATLPAICQRCEWEVPMLWMHILLVQDSAHTSPQINTR